LAFAAFWYARNGNGNEPALNTVAVSRGDIQNLVSATGVLEPSNYVDVGAQVSGQLELIHVRVGQPVSTGDLLAEIDPTVYVAKVDATRAQLKNQQAQLVSRSQGPAAAGGDPVPAPAEPVARRRDHTGIPADCRSIVSVRPGAVGHA